MTEKFWFDGQAYDYFAKDGVFPNEKTIEIPIFKDAVECENSVLEIGNVLKMYCPDLTHTVLDSNSKGKNTISKDIFEFKPKKKYDIVVAVSSILEPALLLPTIECMKQFGNRVLLSIPLGYCADLDAEIKKIPIEKSIIMKRISRENWWIEHHGFVSNMRYGYPHEDGNWILFLEFNS